MIVHRLLTAGNRSEVIEYREAFSGGRQDRNPDDCGGIEAARRKGRVAQTVSTGYLSPGTGSTAVAVAAWAGLKFTHQDAVAATSESRSNLAS